MEPIGHLRTLGDDGAPVADLTGGTMKKPVLAVAAIGVVALLLCGCTPATPAAAPSPARTASAPHGTPRPTPSSTVAPVPVTRPTTPAPAPEPEPSAAPEPWIVTEDGIGPYRLGDEADEAGLLGSGFTADNAPAGYCIQLYTYASGDSRQTKKQEFEVTLGVQNHRIVYAYTSAGSPDGNVRNDPRSPRTDTGITFGTPFSDVQATFPGIQKIVDYGGYREYVVGVNGRYLHVTTSGSLRPLEVVWGLRAATYPGESVPGC